MLTPHYTQRRRRTKSDLTKAHHEHDVLSTPLYYACLCGHEELVKYLLENGARCEANTFDGERCLYGALTDSIKKLLLSYNMVSSKVMRRDLYDELLRRYVCITMLMRGENIFFK
ncbi:hypothetical protein DPMN_017156 [Dreissena polymorpha]|uniref:Uncharacterized protein n=1 Tax=Dreissena polymorpha TaxID=45954 RepID=A0A9D4NEC3_DREPO|nr:hypothetical protein DPMN_017156 [Dreissena polymorpha]